MVEVDPIIIAVIAGIIIIPLVLIVGKSTFFGPTAKTSSKSAVSSQKSSVKEEVQKPKKKKPAQKRKPAVKPEVAEPEVVEKPVPKVVAPPPAPAREVVVEPDEDDDDDDEEELLPAPTKKALAKQKAAAAPKKVEPKKAETAKKNDIKETKEVKEVKVAKPVEVKAPIIPDEFVLEDVLSQSKDDSDSDDVWAVVKKPKTKRPNGSAEEDTPQAAPVEAPAPTATAPSVPSEPIDKVTDDVVIPAKKVGAIIGPKGTIKFSIQAATRTEISLPKVMKESTEPVTATITGPAEGVKKAKKAIQDLVTKGFSALLEPEDFRETQVPVHQMYLPDIIGKGGANIRAIQDSLQVKVIIPQSSGAESKSSVKIGISGMKDNVIKAKALIKELLLYYHTDITHPGVVHEELDIPSNFYNYIIGAKGSEIKHIQSNFKVSVHIPNMESVNKNIVVVGQPSNVDHAKKYILKIIDNVVNGVRKDAKGKIVTNEEEAVDVIPPDAEPSRPSEVNFEDLLSTARHVQGTHSVSLGSRNASSESMTPSVPEPQITAPKPVASAWANGGSMLTGGTAAGVVLAAGSTGMEW